MPGSIIQGLDTQGVKDLGQAALDTLDLFIPPPFQSLLMSPKQLAQDVCHPSSEHKMQKHSRNIHVQWSHMFLSTAVLLLGSLQSQPCPQTKQQLP